MALIDTVPTRGPVLPSDLKGKSNGKLPPELLRNFDGRGALHWIVSYGMQALHLAAWSDQIDGFGGIDTETVGRYRSFEQQVNLVHQRMSRTYRAGATTRFVPAHTYQGVSYPAATWYLLPGMAQVATPGDSNHGWGSADDVAEENNGQPGVDGMSDRQLTWMRDNAPSFGFALESRKERWHWCWIGGDVLPQRAIDVLRYCGVAIPAALAPTIDPPIIPPGDDDDMAVIIKGDGAPSYWAWSAAGIVGVPSLEWVAWGVEQGLYRNSDPVVYPQGHVDALVAAQAER